VALVSQFSQHGASTLLSYISRFFTAGFHNVRIACGLGRHVSEEYTSCIFSKLSEDEVLCFVRTACIPDCLALVWRDTISVLSGVENDMKWRCRIMYEILGLGG
jgi:hypothetical protein